LAFMLSVFYHDSSRQYLNLILLDELSAFT